jgi:hypothetical protein
MFKFGASTGQQLLRIRAIAHIDKSNRQFVAKYEKLHQEARFSPDPMKICSVMSEHLSVVKTSPISHKHKLFEYGRMVYLEDKIKKNLIEYEDKIKKNLIEDKIKEVERSCKQEQKNCMEKMELETSQTDSDLVTTGAEALEEYHNDHQREYRIGNTVNMFYSISLASAWTTMIGLGSYAIYGLSGGW